MITTRCQVPGDLESVSSVRNDLELPARDAFGHIGFTNVITWADPKRQVAATLMTSGKPLLYPGVYYLYDVLRQIGTACNGSAALPRKRKSAAGQPTGGEKRASSRKRTAASTLGR